MPCPLCDDTGYKDYAGFAMDLCPCDSGSGSQSEDAPQSAAEAEGPQSGGNEDCRIAQPPSSSPESTP